MKLQKIFEFLKNNPIITVLLIIVLMLGVGLASKNGSEKYYANHFKEQLKIEKKSIEDKYKQQIIDLKLAREKADNDLNNSITEVNKLNGLLNGLFIKENDIKSPKDFDEIQDRLRRLGYETNISNINTSN